MLQWLTFYSHSRGTRQVFFFHFKKKEEEDVAAAAISPPVLLSWVEEKRQKTEVKVTAISSILSSPLRPENKA